jgi:hypothetical protein
MVRMEESAERSGEWFVPRRGPLKVRIFIGLLFLPYTAMVLSFALIGSMLAETVHWDRVLATLIVYFLGLGIAAHAIDALGSRRIKPWGRHFSRLQLWSLAGASLVLAYGIAAYYMIRYVPLLWVVAALEGFFVFAYNLEWFDGRFHTDASFVFSWGMLPVIAGYMMQTNSVSVAALVTAAAMGLLSYIEITASRPYKELKRMERGAGGVPDDTTADLMARYERILKSVSSGVILLAVGMAIHRW